MMDRLPPELIDLDSVLPLPLSRLIERHLEWLVDRYPRILRCRAIVEGPGRHHRHGRFQIRIRITLPGCALEISRRTSDDPAKAVQEACDAARRQVTERMERKQRKVKMHSAARKAL